MSYSEIIAIGLVYSGLFIYFLVPVRGNKPTFFQQMKFKQSLFEILFHKKAILALILLGFILGTIWQVYGAREWHINAHSGFAPISLKSQALFTMLGVCAYSIFLILGIAGYRTFKKGTI